MLRTLFGPSSARDAVDRCYRAVVERSRDPIFYRDKGVPDTVEGRFELLTLHAFLVLHRLKPVAAARAFAQDFFDRVFSDVDRGLRDLGVGDLSVGRQVKMMATGFYGRVAAYEAAIEISPYSLEEALRRNLFATATVPPLPDTLAWFAHYMRSQVTALASSGDAALIAGAVPFTPIAEA